MINGFRSRVFIFKILAISLGITIIPTYSVLADTSSADYIFLLDSSRQSCQQIGETYQEVRAFETDSFYINICQKDNNYYYLGEAKTGNIDTIFIPANALEPGEMYRANNGNVAYLVTILPNEEILTIERNGAQIAIENSLDNIDNLCLDPDELLPIQEKIASQIYSLMSDARIIEDRDYIELNQIETLDLSHFDRFNSLSESNPEAILTVPSCDR